MKCKDCTMDCWYRTSDGEKECEFQNRIIQVPDECQNVRIQAAIAAMQGALANCYLHSVSNNIPCSSIAKQSVLYADALIEELKNK